MYTMIIFFAVILFTQLTKKYVYPKWGNTGIHIVTFLIALALMGTYQYAQSNIDFKNLLVKAAEFLAAAITLYEVILKKIGVETVQEKLTE